MTSYYNEFDPKAAAWLRELIARGLIAPGIVDERSIADVRPSDLNGFVQCHFFAGIGVWSHALRNAGWSDDRSVWTGSCPCQPFSAAGKGGGFDDERHLWPHFHWLISQCRPDIVFGEQVASKDGLGWLDLVQADLEGTGYASGAVDLCAAGVGAPHIRQRLWWFGERLADDTEQGRQSWGWLGIESDGRGTARVEPRRLCDAVRLEHISGDGRQQRRPEPSGRGAAGGRGVVRLEHGQQQGLEGHGLGPAATGGWVTETGSATAANQPSGLADSNGGNTSAERQQRGREQRQQSEDRSAGLRNYRPGPTNGLWADADWLHCRDGKWRPVEPGTFPLAHGAPERVGRLRGYGNAIVAPAAQAFIEAWLETEADRSVRMTDAAGDLFA